MTINVPVFPSYEIAAKEAQNFFKTKLSISEGLMNKSLTLNDKSTFIEFSPENDVNMPDTFKCIVDRHEFVVACAGEFYEDGGQFFDGDIIVQDVTGYRRHVKVTRASQRDWVWGDQWELKY